MRTRDKDMGRICKDLEINVVDPWTKDWYGNSALILLPNAEDNIDCLT